MDWQCFSGPQRKEHLTESELNLLSTMWTQFRRQNWYLLHTMLLLKCFILPNVLFCCISSNRLCNRYISNCHVFKCIASSDMYPRTYVESIAPYSLYVCALMTYRQTVYQGVLHFIIDVCPKVFCGTTCHTQYQYTVVVVNIVSCRS